MKAPLCRVCLKEHWTREPHILPTGNTTKRTPATPSAEAEKPAMNTQREGRRVLKAEAARPDATRTAATAKPNPPQPPAKAGKRTHADKVRPGKPKTAKAKRTKKR